MLASCLALMLHCANVGAAEIHEAVKLRDTKRVAAILKSDPDAINAGTPANATPLHHAAGLNAEKVIQLLLAKGADPDARTTDGYTPLHWAAYMDAPDGISLLVRKGANLRAETDEGVTPLAIAFNQKRKAAAAALLNSSSLAYTSPILDFRTQKGQEAIEGGLLSKAEKTLAGLNGEERTEKTLFALGMARMSLGRHRQAAAAFREVTKMNPGNGRAFAELGACLARQGKTGAARKAYMKALESNPSPAVEAKLKQLVARPAGRLQGIKARRWTVRGNANITWYDDDNVNVGPDSDVVDIAPITVGTEQITTLEVAESSQPKHAQGLMWSLALSTIHDSGVRGEWLNACDISYFQNRIPDATEHESLFYQVAAGPRKLTRRYALNLPVKLGHISTGGEPLLNIYGVSPSYTRPVWGGKAQLTARADIEYRDYEDEVSEDSEYVLVEGGATRFMGQGGHSAGITVSVFRDSSEAAGHTGATLLLGGTRTFPFNVQAYGSVRYTYVDYSSENVLAPEERKDSQYQLTAGVRGHIAGKWGYNAGYQYTDNESTFDLHDYDRGLATIGTFTSF